LSDVSVAEIAVWPGNQLPHVVVDNLVFSFLTASSYPGPKVAVEVGDGTEIAYL
jgi:hypothetical protein